MATYPFFQLYGLVYQPFGRVGVSPLTDCYFYPYLNLAYPPDFTYPVASKFLIKVDLNDNLHRSPPSSAAVAGWGFNAKRLVHNAPGAGTSLPKVGEFRLGTIGGGWPQGLSEGLVYIGGDLYDTHAAANRAIALAGNWPPADLENYEALVIADGNSVDDTKQYHGFHAQLLEPVVSGRYAKLRIFKGGDHDPKWSSWFWFDLGNPDECFIAVNTLTTPAGHAVKWPRIGIDETGVNKYGAVFINLKRVAELAWGAEWGIMGPKLPFWLD